MKSNSLTPATPEALEVSNPNSEHWLTIRTIDLEDQTTSSSQLPKSSTPMKVYKSSYTNSAPAVYRPCNLQPLNQSLNRLHERRDPACKHSWCPYIHHADPKRQAGPNKLRITLDVVLYYTILYYTILYYTILYYTILYYTILYYTILYYTILYYTILYYTILYYTILYYTILYYTMLYYTILYYTILYYTILYYTILYYTVLYYTILD